MVLESKGNTFISYENKKGVSKLGKDYDFTLVHYLDCKGTEDSIAIGNSCCIDMREGYRFTIVIKRSKLGKFYVDKLRIE